MQTNEITIQIIDCFERGNKLLIFGNGGSATMANHMAAEFIGKVRKLRKALPAISLCGNEAILTAIANDYFSQYVFSRQVEALANKGDIVIGISTSGRSGNVNEALRVATEKQCITIDFPRKGKDVCEVQNYQLKMMHDICCKVEDYYAEKENK